MTILPNPLREYGDCVVYAAINAVNGKMYIGATEKGLPQRSWRHICRAGRGEKGKFPAAIRKHGKGSFDFFAIEECTDFWHALERERYYIAALKPEYNMTNGGGGVKGFKFSAEAKAKMSAAKKGKPQYKFTAADIEKSKATRAKEVGTKVTDPVRLAAIRQSALKGNAARRRKVICSDGSAFDSIADAARQYGKNTGHISRLCKYMKSFKSGLYFRYSEDA